MLQSYCTRSIAKEETKALSKQTCDYPRLVKFLPVQCAKNDDIFLLKGMVRAFSFLKKNQGKIKGLFEYRIYFWDNLFSIKYNFFTT